jgi:hypothetical protein
MNAKDACAGMLGIIFLGIFIALVVPYAASWPAIIPGSPGVGVALWKGRTYEVLLQGMIILAGVFSILLLLGFKQSGRMLP